MNLIESHSIRIANIPIEETQFTSFFFQQIQWVSESLDKMITENHTSQKIEYSLKKYFNRAKYRATPLGLFSSIVFLDKLELFSSNITISEENIEVIQPTSEWIFNLVDHYKKKEFANYSFSLKKNTVYEKFDFYCVGAIGENFNLIQKNKIISDIFEILVTPTSLATLSEKMSERNVRLPEEFLLKILNTLVSKGFLQTEFDQFDMLDPRLFVESKSLVKLLSKKDREKIEDIQAMVLKFNNQKKIDIEYLKKIMSNIVHASKYLDIFSLKEIEKVGYAENTLVDELETFSDYLIDYSKKHGFSRKYLNDVTFFKNVFGNTKVPFKQFYKLYDIYKEEYYSGSQKEEPKSFLEKSITKYCEVDSIYSKLQILDMNQLVIDNSSSYSDNRKEYPTMQLSVIPYKVNEKVQLRISSLEGAFGMGGYENRFYGLNKDYINKLIEDEIRVFKKNAIDLFYINYYPDKPKYFSILPVVYNKNTLNFGMCEDEGITLDELYVHVDKDRIEFTDRYNQICSFKNANMGNLSMIAPSVIQDLVFWSKNYFLNNFALFQDINDFKRKYGYLPEIRFKNIIIRPQTYKLNHLFKKNDFEFNSNKIQALKRTFPKHDLFIRNNDLGFLLQEDIEFNVKIIEECLKKSESYELELISNFTNTIVSDTEKNHYYSEFIFNLESTEEFKSSKKYSPLIENDLRYTFNNNWTQVNFYIPFEFQALFINSYLRKLVSSINTTGNTIDLFFIRYYDKKPMIRVRFKSNSQREIRIINKLNQEFRISEKELEISHYKPEIYRYGQGNTELVSIAEDIFCAESVLIINQFDLTNISATFKIYFIMVTIIFRMYNSNLNSIKIILENKVSKKDYSKLFRKERTEFTNLFLESFFCESEDYKADIDLSNWVFTIDDYLKSLRDENIEIETRIFSVIHMLGNRLFGIDRDFESKCLNYLYRIIRSELVKKNITK
ncbi:thiopeptide-type bacteriocin biosynthesis protein [Enterococcus gallinarum]|uniref:lantibiotic dehydratase n=1 Tax=Enterococcus gallinarum TaxID=1353 RepID=UPI00338F81AE